MFFFASKQHKLFSGVTSPLPAQFSPGLRQLLSCLLATEPSLRPTIAEVSAHHWISKKYLYFFLFLGVRPSLDCPFHIPGGHHSGDDPVHSKTTTTTLRHQARRPGTAGEPPPSVHNSKTIPLPVSGSGPGCCSVQMARGVNGCHPTTSS